MSARAGRASLAIERPRRLSLTDSVRRHLSLARYDPSRVPLGVSVGAEIAGLGFGASSQLTNSSPVIFKLKKNKAVRIVSLYPPTMLRLSVLVACIASASAFAPAALPYGSSSRAGKFVSELLFSDLSVSKPALIYPVCSGG